MLLFNEDATLSRYRNNGTAVFWDIEDCKIPEGEKVSDVAENMKTALKACGYVGTVSIMVYGDTKEKEDEFHSAGIKPIHVATSEGLSGRFRKLTLGMWDWVINHRYERSNILLVMGDMSPQFEFIKTLYNLKNKNFNILLSQPPEVRGPLLSAAHKVWIWPSLALGEAPITETQRNECMSKDTDFVDYYSDEDED